MHLDSNISLGNLITVCTLIWALGYWVSQVRSAIDRLTKSVEDQGKQLSDFVYESRSDRQDLHRELGRIKRGTK